MTPFLSLLQAAKTHAYGAIKFLIIIQNKDFDQFFTAKTQGKISIIFYSGKHREKSHHKFQSGPGRQSFRAVPTSDVPDVCEYLRAHIVLQDKSYTLSIRPR